jgi:hypothetical protein
MYNNSERRVVEETIPISKIKITRKVSAKLRKQQIDLANHIARNGLQVPVLVDANYQLIDGLRRMRAAQDLGVSDITVTVSHTYDESVEALAQAHATEAVLRLPLSSERIWEISQSTRDQMLQRVRDLGLAAARKQYTGKGRGHNHARNSLTKALRLSSPAYISDICFFYSRVNEEGVVGAFARNAVRKMESGEWSPYAAKGAFDRWRKEQAKISDEDTQRGILARATVNLLGIARPVSEVGALHHALTEEELFMWEQQLGQVRTILTLTINKIRNERESRNA